MTATAYATVQAADAILVAAARSGDLFAWEHLVRRHQESVHRVAFLVVRDSALAEVATESTFLRAYRALPSLEDDRGLQPWLFRIAAAEARQQRRDASRPRPSSRPIERVSGPRRPAGQPPGMGAATVLSPPQRESLGAAFDRLGEDDRLIIAMRYLFGLSLSDAAAAMSTSVAAVEPLLREAMLRLRSRTVVDG